MYCTSQARKNNLIILRAGDSSLHPVWYSGADRNWDLVLSYYGDLTDPFPSYRDLIHFCKGSKWQGISDFCSKNTDFIAQYDRVWLPDDDLFINCKQINEFFSICRDLNFCLAQPSLTAFSYVSHPITICHPGAFARETNFVEIMAPCFSARAWNILSPSFDENSSGWGLEWLWANELHARGLKLGIVDTVSMYHSRPVGSAGHGGANSPRSEMKAFLKKHNLSPHQPANLQFIPSRDNSGTALSTEDLALANRSIISLISANRALKGKSTA
jgi:hypothetical protein